MQLILKHAVYIKDKVFYLSFKILQKTYSIEQVVINNWELTA